MEENRIKNLLKELISKGKVEEACSMLISIFHYDTKHRDHIHVLYHQYIEQVTDKNLGLGSDNHEKNRIVLALLEKINEIKIVPEDSPRNQSKTLWFISGVILLGVFIIFTKLVYPIINEPHVYKYEVLDFYTKERISYPKLAVSDNNRFEFISCDSLGICELKGKFRAYIQADGYLDSDELILNEKIELSRIELKRNIPKNIKGRELIEKISTKAMILYINKDGTILDQLSKDEFINSLKLPSVYLDEEELIDFDTNTSGLYVELIFLLTQSKDFTTITINR